jgi:hypothetical protein
MLSGAQRSRSISTASAKPSNEAMEMLRSAQHDSWGVVTKFHKQLQVQNQKAQSQKAA